MIKRDDVWADKDEIIRLYQKDNLSPYAISKMFNCSRRLIAKLLESHGIPRRRVYPELMGEKNPKWKGGRIKTRDGYIAIYQPSHPDATQAGYVLEHRMVMERELGRRLLKTEKVHHINGIRDANKPKNLELYSIANHNLRQMFCIQCPLREEIKMLRRRLL